MDVMLWRPIEEVTNAGVVTWNKDHLKHCDPYLVWADASTCPPKKKDREPDIAVLIELKEGESVLELLGRMNVGGKILMVPNQLGQTYPTSFVTGIVSRGGLEELINEVLQQKIKRFALQGARSDISSLTRERFNLNQEYGSAVQPSAATHRARPRRKAKSDVRGTAYLGILDDGLPFLRVRSSINFLDNLAHLWDQGWMCEGLAFNPDNPDGKPPSQDDLYWRLADKWTAVPIGIRPLFIAVPTAGFLYGRRTKKPTPQASADRDEYAASRYVHPAPRQTHGASVLGLMAPWLSTRRRPVEWPRHIAGLAMVQLPTVTVDDTSGGSLAMRVLDGIRYVLWQEMEDRESLLDQARPTVVNVSYGVHGGPHDGTSIFERAAKEALDKNKHLHLVLPMGNAHRAGIHARHRLRPQGERHDHVTLKVRVMPDSPRDTFVEIWLPECAKIRLEIFPPGEREGYKLKEDEALMAYEPEIKDPKTPRVVRFAGIYPARVANGTNGTMVLVAIGATRSRYPQPSTGDVRTNFEPIGANQEFRRAVIAPPGEWRVDLHNCTEKACEVNAWIERDDAAPDRSQPGRQAWFPDSARPEVRTWQDSPEATVNGVATFDHEHLHVIGAMRANGRLSFYSAARAADGTARPPDAVTVADWSPAVQGILSLGFTQGAVTRLNGTSAACAVYSRALAQQLAQDPTKLPHGAPPGFVEAEFDSGPEDEPSAPDALRGEDKRMFLPFDVEIVTRPPR